MAQSNGAVEQIDGDLASIMELLGSHPDLNRLWMHPVVSADDKKRIVRDLFAGKVHPMTLSLLQLLFDKKRGTLIAHVQKGFHQRFNTLRRRATVKVTSALPLDGGLEDALRSQIASQLQKDILMETAVDPSLIGGMVLQIEDQVIDNSLRGRLQALSRSMN